jgi:hypothetical protein
MAKNDVISLLAVIISVCLTTCCSFNLQSKIALHSSKNCHGCSGRVSYTCMMLPGQYRFVLKTPLNKRSTIPLDAGNSRTDLIQAEGSGSPCRIKVIGVGGGGGNAVNRMIESSTGVAGVELWVVNTDAQALSRSLAPRRLNIGNLTSRYHRFATFFSRIVAHCNKFLSR